jgi:nucleoside-diphosphate-sugar epimerase
VQLNNIPSGPILQADDYRCGYSGVNVMVLGSTGFIGRWVARELCLAGARLTLPVRNLTYARTVFAAYGIDGNICGLDLRDQKGVRELIRRVGPAITFNLAGYGVDRDQQNEAMAHQINAGLIEILCSSITEVRGREWSGLDIVNAGTAMEYGSAKGNLSEDSVPRPTTLYGRSKLAGTNALSGACKREGIYGVTARLFSVYGPGEATRRLLPTLMHAAGTMEPIPLTDGLHFRDFIYVRDVAEGLLRLGMTSSLPGDVVNVATGALTTVRCFAETAADALGISRERMKFGALPTRGEEMFHGPVATGRLRRLTNWSPMTHFHEGILKTVSFGQSTLSRTAAVISG